MASSYSMGYGEERKVGGFRRHYPPKQTQLGGELDIG